MFVRGHKSPLFHPKRKPFLEKAVQTSVGSPGMLEAPSHPRGGPGLGGDISLGLQGIYLDVLIAISRCYGARVPIKNTSLMGFY